jgi:hypothetical protein
MDEASAVDIGAPCDQAKGKEPDVHATTNIPQSASGHQLEQVRLQRAIVNTMLVEPDRKWTRAEMERDLYEQGPLDLSAALEHLGTMQVIVLNRETFSIARCTAYLDQLGVIGV